MDLMTTAELARYLRIGERKVYQLASGDEIPRVRVGGKLLFPRELVDQWLARSMEGLARTAAQAPPVFAGSEDLLLDWALRESDCGLSALYVGSMRGVRRLVDREVMVAGLHLIDSDSGDYNVPAHCGCGTMPDLVMLEWAWREQGLMLAPDNPLGVRGLDDLPATGARLMRRQQGAGADLLLRHLLGRAGIEYEAIACEAEVALSDSDLAAAVVTGRADCGVGIEAVARSHGLDFVPLQRERYDLAMRRRDYFSEPVQALFAFARGKTFHERAVAFGGYDTRATGRVVYNA